jgi:hypothetical protein
MAAGLISHLRRTRRRARALGLVGLLIVAGCGGASEPPGSGDIGPVITVGPAGPATTVSPAVGPTRAAIDTALAERGITLIDTRRSFRPIEAPALVDVPRTVVQAVLPSDPDHGFIVIYELLDTDRAMTMARAQADYLASGPGRVQAPSGTVHIVRVVGQTVIMYSWHPDASIDGAEPSIQQALESIGIEVPIPG